MEQPESQLQPGNQEVAPISPTPIPNTPQQFAAGQVVEQPGIAQTPYSQEAYHVYLGQPQPAPKKSKKGILLGGVIFVVLVTVGTGILFWQHKNHRAPTATNTSANKSKTSSKSTPAPHVTSGAAVTLGLGTFAVGPGKEVLPGFYAISPGPQQSGNFAITSSTGNLSVILDNIPADPYGTSTAWVFLATGDTLQFSGGRLKTITFTPVPIASTDPPILSKLYEGTFNVSATDSRGILPGKHLATSDPGTTGDVLVVSKDYRIKYSQTLDNTGFVVDLAEGDRVTIAHLNRITFGPKL